ncbi:MAG: PIN domain-containing protein [Alphaproteobacteria bacterium]|nr:PIN domain-containing protein [Alphaproteobacteria bacterium]
MFLDTNLFIPARFDAAPAHAVARAALNRAERSGEVLRINRQVIREYLAAATRPQAWSAPLPMSRALSDLSWMEEAFEVLEDGPQVMDLLARLCRDIPMGGKQVHDANIVATMLAYGERRLLTFNVRDFRRFAAHIEILDPAGIA